MTERALSISERALSVTERMLSVSRVTEHALSRSVTESALSSQSDGACGDC